jgi:hypothetical protein
MKTAAAKSKVTRLTPKPEVLRELYLLSGNNCAMPGCKNVIIDRAGVVVGHIGAQLRHTSGLRARASVGLGTDQGAA